MTAEPAPTTVSSTNNESLQTLAGTTFTRGASTFTLPNVETATITGGSSANTINASGASIDVTLSGLSGNDTLLGGNGDDTINGGSSSDTLTGGPGDDTINGGSSSSDTLVEQRDGDVTLENGQFSAGSETDTLISVERATITGGPAAQTLDAGAFSGPVTLVGAGDSDVLTGGSASDTLDGGPGNDTLNGNNGFDIVRATGVANGVLTNGAFTGTLGSDTLSGMNGADLTGTGNDDSIDASAWGLGSVTIDGLGGNDAIQGGTSGDTLTGGTGNDTIDGNGGTDTIVETLGGAGSVVLTNTSLGGSLGTDTLTEIEQATINGSAGADSFSASSFTGFATLDGRGSGDSYSITLAGAGVFNLLDSGGGPGDAATVFTGAAADTVNVTATQVARGAETVGLSGMDALTVNLGGGNDSATISGGTGSVLGGSGDDTFTVQAVAANGLTLNGNEGSDATSISFGNLAGPVSVNDTGLAGTDSLTTDCSTAVVVLGTVTVGGQTVSFSGIEVPPCTAPPAPPGPGTPANPTTPKPKKPKCTIKGTNKDDIIRGTRKRDVICGKKGDDIIIGLKGNDVLIGGRGNDILDGGPGKDELHGDLGLDKLLGGKGVDKVFGGGGKDHGTIEAKTKHKKAEKKFRSSVERTLRTRALKKVQRKIAKALTSLPSGKTKITSR